MSAESAAQDVQVPLDEDGRVLVVDAELERRARLFSEYRGFQEARLYRAAPDSFVLEVLYQPAAELHRDRIAMTSTEVEAFRARVTASLRRAAPAAVLDQTGRRRFLAGTTALSLGYYGWALPSTLGVPDGRGAGAIYLATGAAGFFLPFLLTRNQPVPEAAAIGWNYGATRGILHGFAIASVFEPASERPVLGLGMAVSLAEGAAFYHLAARNDWTPGRVETIGVGGDLGMLLGLGTGLLLMTSRDTAEDWIGIEYRTWYIGPGVVAGSALGMLGGNLLAVSEPYTQGDARILRTAASIGLLFPLGIVDLGASDNFRHYIGAGMLGLIGGTATGYLLLRDRNFTRSESSYIELSSLGGALIGGGIATLADAHPGVSLLLSSVGSAAGFALMYASFQGEARARPVDFDLGFGFIPATFPVADGSFASRAVPGLKARVTADRRAPTR